MHLQIFSTFQHSHYIELAISELKEYKSRTSSRFRSIIVNWKRR